MAADSFISSLQPLDISGSAPLTMAHYLELCREQLSARVARAIAFVAVPPDEGQNPTITWGPANQWIDLDGQLRNAIATERARARGLDPTKWHRPVKGCSLYWANRISSAFQEKDPARRDLLLDQVRWDAAGELTPPASPLSAAAALTYAIRLGIVLRRNAISATAGNETFDRLTAASKLDL